MAEGCPLPIVNLRHWLHFTAVCFTGFAAMLCGWLVGWFQLQLHALL
jgi:hypothetical protein